MAITRNYVVDDELSAYVAAHSTPANDVQQLLMTATEARTGNAARMQSR